MIDKNSNLSFVIFHILMKAVPDSDHFYLMKFSYTQGLKLFDYKKKIYANQKCKLEVTAKRLLFITI